jgi:uncharacterized protein involved in exopolysaccharide biosynthesis
MPDSRNSKQHESNTFIRLLGVLWRGKWIIIFCGFFIGGAMLFVSFLLPKIYSSQMTILLPERQTSGAMMMSALTGQLNLGGMMSTSVDLEVTIMNSPSVLEEVVVEYGLLPKMTDVPSNPDKTPYLSDFHANEIAGGNEFTFEFINDDGDYIVYDWKEKYKGSGSNYSRFRGEGFSFMMTAQDAEAGDSFTLEILDPEDAANALASMINITPSTADTIEITAEATSPVMAQNIVTAIVNKYIERTELYSSGNSGRLRSFLENQLNETKAKLEAASRRLARYSTEEMVYEPEVELAALFETLRNLETQRLMAKIQRKVTEAQLETAEDYTTGGATSESVAASAMGLPGAAGTYDVATSNLETQVDLLRLQLAELRSRLADNHPQVRETEEKLAKAEQALREKKRRNLVNELETFRNTEVSLQRELNDLEQELAGQPEKYVEYNQLKMEVTALGEVSKFVAAQYEQARIDEQRALGNRALPRVLTEATYESAPVRPKKKFYALVGGFLGGILGISIVLSRYYLRRTRFFERLKREVADDDDETKRPNAAARRRE